MGSPAARPRIRPGILVGLIVVAVVAYWRLHWPSFEAFLGDVDHTPVYAADFLRHYRPAGARILFDGLPAPGFYYPAFFALLMIPLSGLSTGAALALWTLLQLAAAVALFALPLSRMRRAGSAALAAYTLAFWTAYPLVHNFKWGQVSVMVSAAIVGAVALLRAGRPRLGAALLALATAIKLYPAGFVALWIFRRGRRAAATDLATYLATLLAAFVLLPVLAIGWAPAWHFQALVSEATQQLAAFAQLDPNSQNFAHVVARALGLTRNAGALLSLRALGLLFVLGIAWRCWTVLAREDDDDRHWLALALLFGAIPFVVGTAWPHYFVFLALMQGVAFARSWTRAPGPARSLGAALVAAAILLASTPWQALRSGHVAFASEGWLLASHLLTLGVLFAVSRPPAKTTTPA